ncbi:hypothetical protein K492DRAFT_181968 [Lichtheimia hyalospora FSU 10163]|nr:hypothetical protein K492DRAFT_181968 [Lichtheimia hyalospora FSU 10163]
MLAFQLNEQLKRANISVMEDCKLLADFIEDASNEGVMKRHLAVAYLKAQDPNDEVHVACLDILSSTEEGLIKQALTSVVDATLGKITYPESDCFRGTCKMKLYPKSKPKERFLHDYALYNDQISSGIHIELMTIEVKASKPASNKHEADLVRLGKQLQTIIDKQLLFGVVDPVAVGVLVQANKPNGKSGNTMVEINVHGVLQANNELACADRVQVSSSWYSVQDITIPMLVEAQKNKDTHPTDLILANILHRASLAMVDRSPDIDLEDSFLHNVIANLFENIFHTKPTLEATWFVTEGAHWSVVEGILISGFNMTIYKVYVANTGTYAMVELSSMNLFKTMSE